VRTFHLPPAKPLSSQSQALRFVNERGFVYFWPIKGMLLPTLWAATAGDRPVPNEHDDPGMVTWGWKDDALGKHIWYYGKILRRKATFISLEVAPYFYALSENFGSPEEDYLLAYEEGRLTQAAKQIASGERGVRVDISSRDEIELLANAFNHMLEVNETTMRDLEVTTERALAAVLEFLVKPVERGNKPVGHVVGRCATATCATTCWVPLEYCAST